MSHSQFGIDMLQLPLPQGGNLGLDREAQVEWKVPAVMLEAMQGLGQHAWERDATGQWVMRRAAVEACFEILTGDRAEAVRIADMMEIGTAQYLAARGALQNPMLCSP